MWVFAGPSRPRDNNYFRGRGFNHRGTSSFRGGNRGRGYGFNRERELSKPL